MSDSQNNNRTLSPLEPVVERIESTALLDKAAAPVSQAVQAVLSPGALKDAASGTWLGHALHPALTDVVIGSFLGSTVVGLLVGEEGGVASDRLIMLGIAAYGPTAFAGASDWVDAAADDRVKRVGIVHAVGNLTALGFYTSSLIARRRGARWRASLLSACGASVLMIGGYLGGHMSFRRGIGPDQTAFDPGSSEWAPAADAAQLRDGRPTRVVVDDTPVLLLKDGELIYAIHDRCSHRGCSLSEGEVEGNEIVCGCHGSRFDLRDGSVKRGPATAPQPGFQVRQREGIVEVRAVAD